MSSSSSNLASALNVIGTSVCNNNVGANASDDVVSLSGEEAVEVAPSSSSLSSDSSNVAVTTPVIPRLCANCNAPASDLCTGCKATYYCGTACQSVAWKEGHRAVCRAAFALRALASLSVNPDVVSIIQKAYEWDTELINAMKVLHDTAPKGSCAFPSCRKPIKSTPEYEGASVIDGAIRNPELCHRIQDVADFCFCSNCGYTHYCSDEHKLADLEAHSPMCTVYGARAYAVLEGIVTSLGCDAPATLLAELASLHMLGTGTPVNAERAYEFFRRAALLGHPSSMYAVGRRLSLGDGVTDNPKEGREWYRLAGEGGCTEAFHNLAIELNATNERRAVVFFRRAAEASPPVPLSLLCFGRKLYSGAPGLKADKDAAVTFVERAYLAGVAEARYYLSIWGCREGCRAAYDALRT